MEIPILQPEQHWECPNCQFTDVTYESQPHTRYHRCHGLLGLSAPMVPAGSDCTVRAVVRGDYEGTAVCTKDGDGRPISAIETVRADGSNDVSVFADCATLRGDA